MPFITDMHLQYRLASLVICRSGATTIAEITAAGRVSALIPFPYATNNHQEHNARIIEAANAGEVILDNEISGERLAKSITKAMDEPENLQKMEDNSYQLGSRDATEKVRKICEDLMKNEKNKPKRNNLSKEKIMSCF
jgi:UDP-N-acetylglucosamine--N-acetylmuramyl-(pentapeptide) pyrophosphoryl-undecaprenol N-acetylglucosamine transferase